MTQYEVFVQIKPNVFLTLRVLAYDAVAAAEQAYTAIYELMDGGSRLRPGVPVTVVTVRPMDVVGLTATLE